MAPKAKLVAFHPVHGYKIKPPQDLKTIKRNERERKRVETVNKGFETLRQHVPAAAPVKKLSKVAILNEAMEYIQYLKTVLVHSNSNSDPVLLNYTQTHPVQYQPQMPFQHHQGYHSPMPLSPPYHPQQTQLYSPYHHQQHSDQGFVSDYSQPSPSWHSPAPHQPHSSTHQHQQVHHVTSSSKPQYEVDDESSGEEDDLLEAIADWQQN